MAAKFDLGNLAATPGAMAALDEAGQAPVDLLVRHGRGDWGDLDAHDRGENEAAVRDGRRLLSSYQTRLGVTVWVVTEADRSSTCLLLPEEY